MKKVLHGKDDLALFDIAGEWWLENLRYVGRFVIFDCRIRNPQLSEALHSSRPHGVEHRV